MPQDNKAGGTWLAVSPSGVVACLLNGAFKRHRHQPPYTKSRGIVLTDSFGFDALKEFAVNYVFNGIEPFTIVKISPRKRVEVLRWDEKKCTLGIENGQQPHIWSSAKMYPKNVAAESKRRFLQLKYYSPKINRNELLRFHLSESYENKMERMGYAPKSFLTTVSIISIETIGNRMLYKYIDLVSGEEKQLAWDMKKPKS